MTPYEHQTKIFKEAKPILDKHNMVCLSMEERTGKTLIGLMLAEASSAKNVLIVTRKKAIEGWCNHLHDYEHKKSYALINYESVKKITQKPDLVILDECHAISGYPKPGVYQKTVRKLAFDCPVIFMSATFSAQTFSQLFHIFQITRHSPWFGFKNFYAWFREYGIPSTVRTATGEIQKYDQTKPGVYEKVEHLFISYTRKQLGFEHEPEDILHFIELEQYKKDIYRTLKRDGIYQDIIADSPMKLMILLHQLEGGTIKTEEGVLHFSSEKVEYIKNKWGDSKDMVIMAHYIGEQERLKEEFSNATILSSTAYAEGVDLSHFKDLVIFSQSFSTAQHKQRRARQANIKRKEPIKVHFLLVEKGVSEAVYNTVSINGKNFVDRYYLPPELKRKLREKFDANKR